MKILTKEAVTQNQISIFLADDHRVVIDVISNMLSSVDDLRVVGSETDGSRAVAAALRLRPDVIVLDLSMPGCDGLTAIQLIRQQLVDQRILVLTVSEKMEDLACALQNGAQGYVLKRESIRDIVTAIRAIAAGQIVISGRLISKLIFEYRRDAADWDALSEIDRRLLTLFESGLTPSAIAERIAVDETQVNARMQLFLELVRLRFSAAPKLRQTLPG